MYKIIAFLFLVIWFSGCAVSKKSPILVTKPTWAIPKFQINQGSSVERFELAKLECKKLDNSYEAVLATTDIERMYYLKDQADQFLCQKIPQKNVTPLELRVLQSRLFKTKISNLSIAINTFMKDVGGNCWNKTQLTIGAASQQNIFNSDIETNEIECRSQNKQFNIEFDSVPDGNLVRARIYTSGSMVQLVQITDPKEYSYFFKQIADQLFIEAIQINPAEIR